MFGGQPLLSAFFVTLSQWFVREVDRGACVLVLSSTGAEHHFWLAICIPQMMNREKMAHAK